VLLYLLREENWSDLSALVYTKETAFPISHKINSICNDFRLNQTRNVETQIDDEENWKHESNSSLSGQGPFDASGRDSSAGGDRRSCWPRSTGQSESSSFLHVRNNCRNSSVVSGNTGSSVSARSIPSVCLICST
jgi:hypothetical protein